MEKLKTIGDGYLAVAGPPRIGEDHAERAGRLSPEMLKAAESVSDETGIQCRLRAGLSFGPVAAGVIGKSKLGYDIWGDTVHVAPPDESDCRGAISCRKRANKLVAR